jgi:hypothetical protein
MDRVHGLSSWVHGIVDHSRPLILRSMAQILLKRKDIDDLIEVVDQGVDGWDRAGDVASQRATTHLSRGGGSPDPGVAHATGYHFWWDLTLWTRRIEGNSPRWSSNRGGGNRSRSRDGSQFAPTFGDFDNELQQSASDEIRLHGGGATRRRATWCWLGAPRSPTERRRARAMAMFSTFAYQNSS